MFITQNNLNNNFELNKDIADKIAILVPVASYIEPGCEHSLRKLENDGIKVYRQYGFSAIDQGRCVMAQIALNNGYEHLFWIDSDISFYYKDVYKIINRNINNKYPFIGGAYSVKGWPKLTIEFEDETKSVLFGDKVGGLLKIKHIATGFMYTHKSVYESIALYFGMKPVKIWGGQYDVYPWFLPAIVDDQYMGEDFSFCHRALKSGINIFCDTTVRLAHIGKYSYSYSFLTRPLEKEPDNIEYCVF